MGAHTDSVVPMTPTTQRRRRLPAEIYWRRRLLVLAAILLLVWGAVKLFDGDDSPKPRAAAEPTVSSAPTPTAAVNPVTEAKLAAATKRCDPEKVRISPTVKDAQYSDEPVDMSFMLSTTQKESCIFDAKAADLLIVINANGSAIWDSSVCQEALFPEPVTIAAKWATAAHVTWSGRGSGSSCSKKESYGGPGSYLIRAATLGGEPGSDNFTLIRKPKPKPKATPTPKASPTPEGEKKKETPKDQKSD